jgi:hypothetical protein
MRREPDFKDLNYQLGMYVGEHITFKYLPVLSTDVLKTYTEIQVSKEDARRHKSVNEALLRTRKWNSGDGNSTEAFEVYKALNNELARKYLSEKLDCLVPKVYPTDMDKFREGLMDQLWDTDLSHYLPEDDFYQVGHEMGWADHIILTLKIND